MILRLAITLLAALLVGCPAVPSGSSGAQVFLSRCAACHGSDARGTERGPDLIWQAQGLTHEEIVETALWGSGSMDPVDVSEEEADLVADWVLALVVS